MKIPRILNAQARDDFQLKVRFDNAVVKLYDLRPLLIIDEFKLLNDLNFVKTLKIEKGGYAISWNSEMDLSEYELWSKGVLLPH
jgi:hypothetical protein